MDLSWKSKGTNSPARALYYCLQYKPCQNKQSDCFTKNKVPGKKRWWTAQLPISDQYVVLCFMNFIIKKYILKTVIRFKIFIHSFVCLFIPVPLGGSPEVPKPTMKYSLFNGSWVCPKVSLQWALLGVDHLAQTTSTGSSQFGRAMTLFRGFPRLLYIYIWTTQFLSQWE